MSALPKNATPQFKELALFVRDAIPPEFPFEAIKGPVLSTWALESGWGHSILAKEHNNYAGMKWHKCMSSFKDEEGNARCGLVAYRAWDGEGDYVHFRDLRAFVDGYFHRLDNHPAYHGWRKAAKEGGQAFIEHVAPIWFGKNARDNYLYLKKLRMLEESRIHVYLRTSPRYHKDG